MPQCLVPMKNGKPCNHTGDDPDHFVNEHYKKFRYVCEKCEDRHGYKPLIIYSIPEFKRHLRTAHKKQYDKARRRINESLAHWKNNPPTLDPYAKPENQEFAPGTKFFFGDVDGFVEATVVGQASQGKVFLTWIDGDGQHLESFSRDVIRNHIEENGMSYDPRPKENPVSGRTWTPLTVLAVAACVYRRNSRTWTSVEDVRMAEEENERRKADGRGFTVPISSAGEVIRYLTDPSAPLPEVTVEDCRAAEEALSWVMGIPTRERSSPFERNLYRSLADGLHSGGIPGDLLGLAATALPVSSDGRKKHEKKDLWSLVRASRPIQGISEGATVTVVRSNPHTTTFTKGDGSIGTKSQTLVIFATGDGNALKFFDSKSRNWSIGEKVRLKTAYCGKSEYFKGVHMTRISYVKFLDKEKK